MLLGASLKNQLLGQPTVLASPDRIELSEDIRARDWTLALPEALVFERTVTPAHMAPT